jgi:GAF domain-containing protein
MIQAGRPLGAITVARRAVRPFSDQQIALLQTFADQAVIAIENVRLFKELESRNRDLTQALEQQTATSEVLRVISSSPTAVEPVFHAIVTSGRRLCHANQCLLVGFDGEMLTWLASDNFSMAREEVLRSIFPYRPTRAGTTGRVVLDRAVVHIPDVMDDPDHGFKDVSMRAGARAQLAVPMFHENQVIGALHVSRPEPGPFSDDQIALLKTFADQAVIAIENVRLFNETREALERQTATSEILRVISSSPTNTQPVFDVIAANAARLCVARDAQVLRVEGDVLRLVSAYGSPSMPPVRAISRGHAVGRAVIDRQTIHVRDMAQAVAEFPETSSPQHGVESLLAVPLLREDVAVGVIRVSRTQIQPFTEQQIVLLRTFADQAVIAIENVRLFTELQEKNRALTQAHGQVTEALEQQTATSEVLRVIAGSPTDLQPVLDALVESAGRLCQAADTFLLLVEGDQLRVAALHGSVDESSRVSNAIHRGWVAGRAVADARTVHVEDLANAEGEFPLGAAIAVRLGHRTALAMPLLRKGVPIGALFLRRREVRQFSDKEIALLETFADQAVIAIENVRLFTELQTSNRELTTALETQSATSDILRVISRSQTDVQPVFDTILASAVRLLGAYSGSLTRSAGDQIELAALTSTDDAGDAAVRARYPQSLQSEDPQAQILRDRAPLNIADAQTDPRLPEATQAYARARGWRSAAMVPMLRHGEAVGTISVTRRDPGGFADDEIALLKTFADQAVIAIENARLLTELQARTQELTRSVEQLTALGDVGRAVSSSLDLDTVLTTIVGRAVQLSGTDGGTIFEYDEGAEEFSARATLNADEDQSAMLRATRLRRGEGAVGQMAVTREPIQIPDIAATGAYESRLRGAMLEAGTRAVLAVPLLHEARLVGGLVVTRRAPGAFSGEVIEILKTFATQSALAIQNARLFREVEIKSRELEVASQHKSEFLANMSHELRTPLNAIIGFSEVLTERMFGELNEKQDEYLRDIYASGQHLLSLINDILDLSKIEAGRMELELMDFDLPVAIDNALILVRERAGRRAITLGRTIGERVGMIRADERKVKQVLLNLLSNAIKFTPEGGRIDVRAGVNDRIVEVSVADTGVGIAPEDQQAVFEEFRQVGTADKKVEGTGLGLALSRKFIELHGGRIWVKSQVGEGSTFTFTLPVGRGE